MIRVSKTVINSLIAMRFRTKSSISITVLAVILVLSMASCSREEPLGYASLGDSLAAGVGSSAPSEKSYSALYRDSLQKRTGREVEYRKLGLSGETARSFIGGYPEEGSQLTRAEDFLEKHPGAKVTISLGGNDLLLLRGEPEERIQSSISEYGKDLDFILTTLNESSDPPLEVIALTLYNPEPGEFTDRWISEMNEEIRTTTLRNGASVAEGNRAFQGHMEEYLRYYESGERDIHPNDQGHAALAQALIQAKRPTAETTKETT